MKFLPPKCCFLIVLLVFCSIGYAQTTTVTFDEITGETHLSLNGTRIYDNSGVRFEIFSGSNPGAWVSSVIVEPGGNRALDDTNTVPGGVTGWKITKVDGSAFQLISIWLQNGDINASASGTVKAYKNGSQVGTTMPVAFNGAISFAANPDFYDVDEVRIEGTDLYVLIDNFAFAPALIPVDADPPLATPPTAPTVIEDTPVALAGMGVTDVNGDDQTLTFTVTGGTVTLGTAGISFGGSGNSTASFTASGTLANINNALAVAVFTPTANLFGTDVATIAFVSNDGTMNSNTASITFSIAGVNDGPVFNGNRVISYTENGTPAKFNSGGSIELTEIEGEAIIEAVITFNDRVDGDILSVEAPGPYAVSQATNVITLTGTGTAAQMTSALESIEYSHSGNDPTLGATDNSRSFTIKVKDASGISSNSMPVQVAVSAVNDDPTMVSLPSDIIVFENIASDLDLSPVTFSDVDAGSNSVTLTLEVSDGILAATTGSGVTVGGSGTGILTLSGSPSAIDGYLNSPSNIQYTGTVLGDNAAVLTLSANDGGNTGTGGGTPIVFGTVNIDIVEFNETPVATAPTAPVVMEDTNVALSDDFKVTDADGDDQTLTFTITGGTLEIGTTGIVFGSGTNGSSNFTASGTLANINNALAAATFTPTANLFGTDVATISFVSNDGTVNSNTASVTFSIAGVNDDPTISGLPTDVSVTEDATSDEFDISSAMIADIDAGNGNLNLTLTATGGRLDAAAGITIIGNLTSQITLIGNVAALNDYLNSPSNIWFIPNANLSGDNAASVSISISDNGNTGSGGGNNIFIGTVNIDITPVNDAPTVANPIPNQSAIGGVLFNFQFAANTFDDVDTGDVLTYSAQLNGGGNLPAWLSFDAATRTFSGTPDNSTAGSLEIDVTADDGNGETVTDTFTLTVAVNNTPPTVSGLPTGITIIEDIPSELNIASSTFADSDSDDITVRLSVSDGRIALAATGIPVTLNGNATSAVTIAGAVGAINSYIDIPSNIIYIPAANMNGAAAATLTISANDGDGSGDVQLGTVPINITAVNDAPVNSVPSLQLVAQGASLVFSGGEGNQISISDVDAGASNVRLTLTATNGTLTLSGTAGLVFTVGDGTSNASMEMEGSISDINNALNGLTFTPSSSYYGPAVVHISTNDLGNTGSGGALSDLETIQITVNSVSPVVTDVSSPTEDGTYGAGSPIVIAVTFNQNIDVNTAGGIPTLLLETGSTNREATYSSGSGSETLLFTYTILSGDESNDLDYQSTLALSLHGATLKNIPGDDAILTLPSPGAAGSLGANKALVIDAVKPTGYSVQIDQDPIIITNQTAVSFTFAGAEVGAAFDYSFSSSGGGTNVSGNGAVASMTQQVAGIDLTSLAVGTITLSVTLTDPAGNTGDEVSDTAEKLTSIVAAITTQTNVGCNSDNTGSLTVEVSGGVANYTYSWSNGTIISGTSSTTNDLTGLIAGNYTVTVTDGNGQTATASGTITQPAALLTGIESQTNVSCFGGSDGSATVTVQEGIGPFDYQWTGGGGTDATASGLAAGPYSVTVTDANGCSTVLNVTITQPATASLTTAAVTDVTFSSATLGGTISNIDLGCASETGVVYSTSPNPDLTDSKEVMTISGGAFTEVVSGLALTTTYYARAYSTNSNGITVYGNEVSFTTSDLTVLNVTADSQTKVFGQADPAFTYTHTGLRPGDDITSVLTGTLNRAIGEDVGDYAIQRGTLSIIPGSGYSLSYVGADLSITPAAVTGITLEDGSFTYDGTAKSLIIEGTLPVGSSVSYADNSRTAVGTQEVTATVTGENYDELVLTAQLEITPATITGIAFDGASFTYDGTAKSLAVTGTLPAGTSVAYTDNSRTDVGTQTATATITGDNYDELVLTAQLEITPATITGIDFDGASFTYDGAAKSLSITGTLPAGTSVAYTDNSRTDVGTQEVTATITGENFTTLELTANLTITPADFEGVEFNDASFIYDGTAKSLSITGTLPSGTSVAYADNSRTGVGTQEATATITGENYDELVLTAQLEITPATITGIDFDGASFAYDGTAKSLSITGTLPAGTSVAYTNNSRTDVGTQEVTATITGDNFTTLELTANLTVTPAEFEGIEFNDASFIYDGTAKSLAVTGTLPSGTSVAYTDNSRTAVGTQEATATITGDNYDELVLTAQLEITPATITGIDFDGASFTYDGTAKSLAITGTLPAGTSVAYTDNSRTDVGTQEVTATITGENFTTLELTANLTITPADFEGVEFNDASFIYDGTAKSLAVTGILPSGTSVAYTDNSRTAVGTQEAMATITGENYDELLLTAQLEITPATITGIDFDGASFTYDGTAKSLSITGTLPSGTSVAYTDNSRTDVGTQEVTATITGDNFTISELTANLTITPATLNLTVESGQRKMFGEADPELTYTATGFVAGEDSGVLNGQLDRVAGESIGSYPITIGTLDAGSNYTINYVGAEFEIFSNDTDGDKVPDEVEIVDGTDPSDPDDYKDSDGDGVPDFVETDKGTNPTDPSDYPDSDSDQVPDYVEEREGTDPDNGADHLDEDRDGVPDYVQLRAVTEFVTPSLEAVWGTGLDELSLPTEVLAITGRGEVIDLSPNWDLTGYDPLRVGQTVYAGTADIPAGVFNPYGLSPALSITILEKPAPEDVILSKNEFVAIPDQFFQEIGAFTVVDPSDDLHTLSLPEGEGDNAFFEVSSGSLFWSSSDQQSGRVDFEVILLVQDRAGNELRKSFAIRRLRTPLDQLEVPNTFTPNADGVNDTWGVPALRYYSGVRIQVFDNGGNRLFYTEDPDVKWDGTFKGQQQPVSSYVYVIEVGETGEVRRGMLNLLRQ
jgi:gliding motility-associated-like protein